MSQISHEQITHQALALIDQQGSTLSMRQLGRALGVDAKAIYYYFPNKEHLLRAVLKLALSEMDLSALPAMTWQDRLRTLAREYYYVAVAHPGLIPLMRRVDGSMPAVFDVVEHLVSALAMTTLKPASKLQIIDLFLGFLPSFSSSEISDHHEPGDLLSHLKTLSLEEYPAMEALLSQVVRVNFEDDLDLQINIMIWGIEALIVSEREL